MCDEVNFMLFSFPPFVQGMWGFCLVYDIMSLNNLDIAKLTFNFVRLNKKAKLDQGLRIPAVQ